MISRIPFFILVLTFMVPAQLCFSDGGASGVDKQAAARETRALYGKVLKAAKRAKFREGWKMNALNARANRLEHFDLGVFDKPANKASPNSVGDYLNGLLNLITPASPVAEEEDPFVLLARQEEAAKQTGQNKRNRKKSIASTQIKRIFTKANILNGNGSNSSQGSSPYSSTSGSAQ